MTLRLLRMAYRQHRLGNDKPLKYMASIAWFGLTHWRCRCGRFKGPTLRKLCERCRTASLLRGIFGTEYP